MVQPYYNEDHTKIAVLITSDFGAGWSTWNYSDMAWDSRVVEYFINGGTDWEEKLEEWGYKNCYLGGLENLELEWVDCCKYWRINEYDGVESIEYFDQDDWYWIPNY